MIKLHADPAEFPSLPLPNSCSKAGKNSMFATQSSFYLHLTSSVVHKPPRTTTPFALRLILLRCLLTLLQILQSYSTSQAKTFKLFYPRQPAICIKLSTASPFTTSPPAISIYQVTIRKLSLRQPLLHHFQQDPYQPYRPRHKPRRFMLTLLKLRTLTFQVLFCLLIGDFVPKRIYHLTFAFAFISCAVLLPLLVFIFYFYFAFYFCFTFYFCWLRIRGST